MFEYLESSEYIDWKTPEVFAKARSLADGKVYSDPQKRMLLKLKYNSDFI